MMNLWQQIPTPSSDFRRLWLWLLLSCCVLSGCTGSGCTGYEDYQRLSGATMGTYYTVVSRCAADVGADELQNLIEAELAAVNAVMSTYDPDSVLSRFNRGPSNDWQEVPVELIKVVSAARELSELSDGAFDITVGPLVNAWGFGPETSADSEPSAQALAQLMQRVGYQKLQMRLHPPGLLKTAPVYVDLSALAKGHGVDRVADLLQRSGCGHYLVDIGGEVRVSGINPRGGLWSIGVEVPDPDSQGGVQRVLRLRDRSVATSGDYRNFRTVAGHRFSHTIDPRSGRPVSHKLASVTVIHESAMWADGLATAIDVLGPEAGLMLARSMELPVLMIIRSNDDYEERYTDAMKQYLVTP